MADGEKKYSFKRGETSKDRDVQLGSIRRYIRDHVATDQEAKNVVELIQAVVLVMKTNGLTEDSDYEDVAKSIVEFYSVQSKAPEFTRLQQDTSSYDLRVKDIIKMMKGKFS